MVVAMPTPLETAGRPFTRADLDTMPDDGRRYEIVDGVLIVSAAPGRLHQRAVLRLMKLLDDARLPAFEVLPAPFAVGLGENTQLQPDVVVARVADLTEKDLPGAPALAVEVLSNSTRLIDLHLKKERLRRAGTPAYWAVDPVARPAEARLIAWELTGNGEYRQVADVRGDEAYEATVPFPVRVVPGQLVCWPPVT
jgi:Uma2 family endonuclease